MPKKRSKPHDTNYFHYYNANPKDKSTSDCVIRALCSVLPSKTYKQICEELLELSIKCGYFMNDKKCYEKYLELNGFKKIKQPRKDDNTKYTGKEFCKYIQKFPMNYPQRIFAHIGGHHVVAIIGGTVVDTWDSTDGCIGNYFYRPVNS
jgi:hypothetical protein